MNDQETEKELLENGFTQNDIAKMRDLISRGGNSEETLSMLTHSLKKAFFNGFFILAILISSFIINAIFNISNNGVEILIHFVLTLFFILPIYYLTPMNLAYKSYSYLKRKSKMG
ncbi:hypothetical protein [Pectobacterium brasiliense]|uniref:hypothetical protein n=1 Tax=Pectobacterium brasiliense TaxID=180957 RepID=UPI001968F1F0|nr:hypothetical protein [Pectobacterium brasiliense]MBN3122243.1 hypothetical protein [Pectobacterium brasiliense]QSD21820.1 hypothetical protein H5A38_16065 [Pectobacterium brasiliense]